MSDVLTVDALKLHIEWAIKNCNATIKKFQEQLENDPRYALEWGDGVYLAVSKMENVKQIQRLVDHFEENYNVENIVEKCLGSLDRFFVNKLQRSGMNGSTSLSHRAMEIADTETAGLWFDDVPLKIFQRACIKKTLERSYKE